MQVSGKELRSSKIKYTTAYPTSIIVNGLDQVGYELAKSLTSQGGYVILIGNLDTEEINQDFLELENTAFLDFSGITELLDNIRRLDYVFFLNHSPLLGESALNPQDFLLLSSYLNQLLNLAVEFESLFLFTDSLRLHKWRLTSDDRYYHDLYTSTEYNYSEFVRYAENLILEFQKSKKLEVKILRIAELLGEGVELVADTNLGKLLPAALTKKLLYLDQDGLSTEYYVHLLDAVYGILKAQFTRNLPDQVYTLAYNEPITQLSLAYRIQENVEDTGDIKFLDEEDSKVRLHLAVYKPAANLEKIGWIPKVDFNTALIQTIRYFQNLLAENNNATSNEKTPQTELTPINNEPIPDNPLAKLIAAQKKSESQQKTKIAHSMQQIEQRKRKLTTGKRFKKTVVRGWDKFKKNFRFLEKLTVAELGIYLILFGIFALIFITVLAPIIGLVKDYLVMQQQSTAIVSYCQKEDWQNCGSEATLQTGTLNSLKDNWQGLEFLFNLTAKQDTFQNGLGLIQARQFLTDSQLSLSKAMTDLEGLNQANQVDLIYRPTNTSIWGLDNSNFVSSDSGKYDLVLIKGNYDNATRAYQNYQRIYQQVNQTTFPQFLSDYLIKDAAELQTYSDQLTASAHTLDFLTAKEQPNYTLAIVLQDHLRSSFSDGEITSLGLLDYQNGVLTNAQLLPIQNLDSTGLTLTPTVVSEIDDLSHGKIGSYSAASLVDLARYTYSPTVRDSLLKSAIKKVFGKDTSEIIYFNSASFTDLLTKYSSVDINDTTVDSNNYLQTISNLQKQSLQSRNVIMTNILGVLLSRMFNSRNYSLNTVIQNLTILESKRELNLSTDLASRLEISQTQSDTTLTLFNLNPTAYNLNPSFDWNVKTTLFGTKADSNVKVNLTNSNGAENLLICSQAEGIDFNTGDLASENFSTLSLNGQKCLLFNTKQLTEFNFNFQRNITDLIYDEGLQINPGVSLRYDYQIDYPVAKKVLEMKPEARQQLSSSSTSSYNSLFYSGEVYNQFRFNITFSTNGEV